VREEMKSPVVLLQYLLTDVKRLEPDVKGLDRDIITIKARFEHEGIGFLSNALSTLCDALDQGLALGQFSCPSGFARIRQGALPKLFQGLLREVFECKTGSLKEAPNIGAIKCLREVLRFFKKVRLANTRSEELHKKACRTFWETDGELSGGTIPPNSHYLLSRVAGYALTGLYTFKPSDAKPRHGPGAVLEGLAPNQKWSEAARALTQCEDEGYSEYEFDCFLASSRSENRDYVPDDMPGIKSRRIETTGFVPGVPSKGNPSGDRMAKLITVPKNASSRRTITVEPLMNMFVQQGLNTILRDEITKCRILRQCLALTDQSENQRLALEGSRTGKWATLDLSSASDRLSNKVVEIVFGKKASFFRAMQECRSTHVFEVGSNQLFRLEKFAGMGNALTFPVQSVVFALIAITAILIEWGKHPTYWNVKRASRLVRVYGDDIIVQTGYVRQVTSQLESFGLKVNQMKSFSVGNFRESCGLDAFRGYDVTPIYVKAELSEPQLDASSAKGLVDLSNACWMRGLYTLANGLQEIVERQLHTVLPLITRKSGGLGVHSRQDSCVSHRWNHMLHRYEYRTYAVDSLKRRDLLSGPGALLKSFLTPLIERGSGHLERSNVRFKTRLRLRWFPVEIWPRLD
jgi:hypothetical protein